MSEEDAEKRVPSHIHRSALYFHSLTEIWEYYRALGNQPPDELRWEMDRAEKIMVEDIRREMGQGGAFREWYSKKEVKR